MDATELARLINMAKDAIDKTDFGPLFTVQHDPADVGNVKKLVNPVAFQVFSVVLDGLLKGGTWMEEKE